jgi:hypothetical protein
MGQQQSTITTPSPTLTNFESPIKKKIASQFALKHYDDAISSSVQLLNMLDEPDRRKSLVNKLDAISNVENNTKKGALLAKMLPTILRPS